VAFLVVAFVISFFPPFTHPPVDAMNWSSVIYGGTLVIALVYYVFKGRRSYVGPVEYVSNAS
jgi:choline transport protein